MDTAWMTSKQEASWNPQGPQGQQVDGLFGLALWTKQTMQTADQSHREVRQDNTMKEHSKQVNATQVEMHHGLFFKYIKCYELRLMIN